MSLTAYFLATWAWWSLGRLIDDEGALSGFETLHHHG